MLCGNWQVHEDLTEYPFSIHSALWWSVLLFTLAVSLCTLRYAVGWLFLQVDGHLSVCGLQRMIDSYVRFLCNDLQVYEDSVELQSVFIQQRDEVCRRGEVLLTPALGFTSQQFTETIDDERHAQVLREQQRDDDERKKLTTTTAAAAATAGKLTSAQVGLTEGEIMTIRASPYSLWVIWHSGRMWLCFNSMWRSMVCILQTYCEVGCRQGTYIVSGFCWTANVKTSCFNFSQFFTVCHSKSQDVNRHTMWCTSYISGLAV